MPGKDDNPDGFWENAAISEANESILRSFGGSWDDPPVLEPDWYLDGRLDGLRRNAEPVLERLFRDQQSALFKDPRAALTLPFWRSIHPITTSVIVVRDPAHVARSLERRNGFAISRSLDLWLTYTLTALASCEKPTIVVYEDLIARPEEVLRRLCAELALPPPTKEVVEQAAQSIRANSPSDVELDDPLLEAARWVFETIKNDPGDPLLGRVLAMRTAQERHSHASAVLAREIEQLRDDLLAERERAERAAAELIEIKGSFAWRTTRRVLDRALPAGSRRARFVRRAKGSLQRREKAASPLGPPRIFVPESSDGVVFPEVTNPKLSVVIPTFDQADHLYSTLIALSDAIVGTETEVIVVDDTSSDHTADLLRSVTNARVVTNDSNAGFIRSTNRGAASASGEYILLLNNDCHPRALALKRMTDVLDRDPSVGLVGAKLVYPNGRLQEAGGIIWRDGTGANYGRNDNPGLPQYNYRREVDYCSAACVMVRREAWLELGGLDERFVPAYYEDVDLAFSLRSIGYRVVYEPTAEAIHFEGISHGTSTGSGIKRYQAINHRKFVSKWNEVLEREHQPPSARQILAKDRPPRPIALVADHHVPTWDRDSGSLRMRHIIDILSDLGFRVVVLPNDGAPKQPYTGLLQNDGVEIVYGVDVPSYVGMLGPQISIALLSRPDVAHRLLPLLRRHAPRARLIYDTVDLHWVRLERQARFDRSRRTQLNAMWSKRKEHAAARGADCVLAITEDEKHLLEETVRGVSPVEVLPNIHVETPGPAGFAARSGLLFVGGFVHPPNADAVRYFVSKILPLIRESLPDVGLQIVGDASERLVDDVADPNIRVSGWMRSLEPAFAGARVFVAPLRYGAGAKGKVGQAMAAGLPCVLTTVAAEGLGLQNGRHALIVDSPAEFAQAVATLYQDDEMWTYMRQEAALHVAENFGYAAARDRMRRILANLGVPRLTDD